MDDVLKRAKKLNGKSEISLAEWNEFYDLTAEAIEKIHLLRFSGRGEHLHLVGPLEDALEKCKELVFEKLKISE